MQRRIIGIVGCPGSGKSTVAEQLARRDPDTHVVVPMDGFHLAQRALEQLGRADRKGAPDTFDVDGYVALLERIRDDVERTIWAPAFDRHLEEPIAGSIAIEPHHTVVIAEGNYLLTDHGGWERVGPLLDERWYVDVDDPTRTARLVARHVEHGRTPEQAVAWVESVDEPNAELIRAGRHRADRVIDNGRATEGGAAGLPGTDR